MHIINKKIEEFKYNIIYNNEWYYRTKLSKIVHKYFDNICGREITDRTEKFLKNYIRYTDNTLELLYDMKEKMELFDQDEQNYLEFLITRHLSNQFFIKLHTEN